MGRRVRLFPDSLMPQSVETAQGTLAGEIAGGLDWLQRNRLVGVVGLLRERGAIESNLAQIAESPGLKIGKVKAWQLDSEREVAAAIGARALRVLILKGALFAWTVYPHPDQRLRSDMDILVDPTRLEDARQVLVELGYRPLYSAAGGTPTEEEAWCRRCKDGVHMVDLHWRLRSHPLLRDRLTFTEQWDESVALPALAEGARGQGPVHAVLMASMHWFDALYASPCPLVWILDMDLIWRIMTDAQKQSLRELAIERGLSGLVAENLAQARQEFGTDVADDYLQSLRAGAHGRRPTRLIGLRQTRVRAHLYALWCEPGLGPRLRRIRSILFPPAEYMRQRYGAGPDARLPSLYWRRISERLSGKKQ